MVTRTISDAEITTRYLFVVDQVFCCWFFSEDFESYVVIYLLEAMIDQQFSLIQEQHVINQTMEISDLMRRDDHQSIWVNDIVDNLSELALRRDIEPISRFIHDENWRLAGNSKCDICLLLLTEGDVLEFHGSVDLKLFE